MFLYSNIFTILKGPLLFTTKPMTDFLCTCVLSSMNSKRLTEYYSGFSVFSDGICFQSSIEA